MEINGIDSIYVHWTNSWAISMAICVDESNEPECEVRPDYLDKLIGQAIDENGSEVVLTVRMSDGSVFYREARFKITPRRNTLIKLLNSKPLL